jgi:GrpB-like predicted nucleotidyltransferase (UPF0157 family)
VSAHPLWRPFAVMSPEEVARARVGAPVARVVSVVSPDPGWPAAYEKVRRRLLHSLREKALAIAHVGSTSVPGLRAKPIIDLDLTVADSADESAWLPELEAAGFTLTVREPDWDEHRAGSFAEPDANVHIWSPGAPEPRRHLAFARWLATHDDDHAAYAGLKRELAGQGFESVVDYNNAKAALIYDIYERIFAADENHWHGPHPRPLA